MMLVVGLIAVSNAAESSESNAMNSSQNAQDAYNATEGVFDGIGQAMGPGIAMMGIAAFVLISLAFLYAAMKSGR
jgi:hypothetical protein